MDNGLIFMIPPRRRKIRTTPWEYTKKGSRERYYVMNPVVMEEVYRHHGKKKRQWIMFNHDGETLLILKKSRVVEVTNRAQRFGQHHSWTKRGNLFRKGEHVIYAIIPTLYLQPDDPHQLILEMARRAAFVFKWLMYPAVQRFFRAQGIAGYAGIVRSPTMLRRIRENGWTIIPTSESLKFDNVEEQEKSGEPTSPFTGNPWHYVEYRFPGRDKL